jgi:uncharacterized membrane protein HdeD (DUF308 family)
MDTRDTNRGDAYRGDAYRRDVDREINMDQTLFGRFKTWSLVLGIGMIILGVLLISLSVFTTFLTVMLLGLIFAFRGLFDSIHAIMAFKERGFWWRLFSGVLSLVVGVLLFTEPFISAASITFMVAVFLITSGLFKTLAAPIEHQSQWGIVMIEGILSLVFGVILLAYLPTASIWFIGTFVGIEILMQGMVMTSLPFAYRPTSKPSGQAFAH